MTKLLDLPEFLAKRRQYGLWTDFLAEGPRQLHTYKLADLDADGDLSAAIIMATPRAIRLHDIGIMPDGADAGIDDSNTCNFAVTDGTNAIVTKVYNTNLTFPNDNEYASLGTLSITEIAASGRIELAVTQGTNSNIVACEVCVSFSDRIGFPENGFEVIATDGGSAAIADGVKGILAISPGASDNDEIYLICDKEAFKFLANKPIIAEVRLDFTEANTNDANVIFGLMDAATADALIDDAGGPKASYSGAVIFKVKDETLWRYESSVAGTQVPVAGGTVTTKTAGGGTYQTLRIEIKPTSSTSQTIAFWIDGVCVGTNEQTLTSGTEMQLIVGVKNGGANAETLNIDYVGAEALR